MLVLAQPYFSEIVIDFMQNLNAYEVFIPGTVHGQAIHACADNIDKKVDTYDGKDSFMK